VDRLQVVLALGRVAFDAYVTFLRGQGFGTQRLNFQHAAFYQLPTPFPALCASYHPSRQNTQTGKLTAKMFDKVFQKISRFLDAEASNPS